MEFIPCLSQPLEDMALLALGPLLCLHSLDAASLWALLRAPLSIPSHLGKVPTFTGSCDSAESTWMTRVPSHLKALLFCHVCKVPSVGVLGLDRDNFQGPFCFLPFLDFNLDPGRSCGIGR